MAGNGMGNIGATALAEVVASCPMLADLDLQQNGIGSDGGLTLGRSIVLCPRLRQIWLQGNMPFSDIAVHQLTEAATARGGELCVHLWESTGLQRGAPSPLAPFAHACT